MKRYLVNNRYTSGTTDKTLANYPLVLCLLMSWSFGHLNQSRSTINMIHSPFPLLISRAFLMANHCFIKNNITSTGLKLTQSQNPQPSTQIVSGSGTSFAFDSWLLNLFKATLHVNQVPPAKRTPHYQNKAPAMYSSSMCRKDVCTDVITNTQARYTFNTRSSNITFQAWAALFFHYAILNLY